MIRATCILILILASRLDAQERQSGYDEMTLELQHMQDDDFANPGMLWVAEGRNLWETVEGTENRSCADCHGDASQSMRGVAARYPAVDEIKSEPTDLDGRVNLCRVRHQGAEPLDRDSPALLALTTFLTYQSRGLPISPPQDPILESWREQGRVLFTTRMGQLNLSCANCHDANSEGHLAAAPIPQGHPTGYPQYRLEWQDMGSLYRRFDNCFFGIRATPFEHNSNSYIALEIYLKARAEGMMIEAPAVRP